MSELKQYWDGLDASVSIDETEMEESLDKVIHKLARNKRIARTVVLAFLPLVVFLGIVVFRPHPSDFMLQCFAPLGEQRQLLLSDGTKVTLNSGSTLVYAEKFDRNQRKVILNGQAVFEVAKNEQCPFVVSTHSFDIKVLGTVFDVSAYSSAKNASVVLSEGSISLDYQGGKTLLVPGQMAEFNKDGTLTISSVEAQDYLSWTNGGFVLKKAGMADIVELLQRQYGLDVKCYYSKKYSDVLITAKSQEKMTPERFLHMLEELIPGMKYKLSIEEKTLELY